MEELTSVINMLLIAKALSRSDLNYFYTMGLAGHPSLSSRWPKGLCGWACQLSSWQCIHPEMGQDTGCHAYSCSISSSTPDILAVTQEHHLSEDSRLPAALNLHRTPLGGWPQKIGDGLRTTFSHDTSLVGFFFSLLETRAASKQLQIGECIFGGFSWRGHEGGLQHPWPVVHMDQLHSAACSIIKDVLIVSSLLMCNIRKWFFFLLF